jgi:hypothetical protein
VEERQAEPNANSAVNPKRLIMIAAPVQKLLPAGSPLNTAASILREG